MDTTPVSLLERLRENGDQKAWTSFVRLYTPLLFDWCRRLGLADADASDLVQDVFVVLVQQIPTFHYDRTGSFRAWLKAVLMNKWRDLGRRRRPLLTGEAGFADLEDDRDRDLLGEHEFQQRLVERALVLMQTEFSPAIWQACWKHVVDGYPAIEVANRLGIQIGTVYVAKARVLGRLREELKGMWEE
jgi:RNA polymerase sigma-70 factor (ECF subfamily)